MPIWFWIVVAVVMILVIFLIAKSGEYYSETREAAYEANKKRLRETATAYGKIKGENR